MSFHELTRRELQTLCKQHGLPANRTNAVMASSLAGFFSEQRTVVGAYVQAGTPCTVTKTRSAEVHGKEVATSLAALILGAPKPAGAEGGLDSLLKKCRDQRRSVVDVDDDGAVGAEGAFAVKSTPLRRRRKKESGVAKAPPVCDERGDHGVRPDSTEILRLPPEETSVLKALTPEPQQLAPNLNPHVLVTDDQDSTENLRFPREKRNTSPTEPQLAPHVLVRDDQGPPETREQEHVGLAVKDVPCSPSSGSETVASTSQANVDTLIQRATGMLAKFEQWKADNPGTFVHRSGQKHLAFDQENLYQQSACKNLKLRSLQAHQKGAQTDRKEGVLKDLRVLNVQT